MAGAVQPDGKFTRACLIYNELVVLLPATALFSHRAPQSMLPAISKLSPREGTIIVLNIQKFPIHAGER